MKAAFFIAALAATAVSAPASAAFIVIDDTDPNTITISAGDFEDGFSVDGTLLTFGLGDSDSITLPDGGYSISGRWIDLGLADGARIELEFALPGDPTGVTSGIEFNATSDGSIATLDGSFGGFSNFVYFTSALLPLVQGTTGDASAPFLSLRFISEVPAAVPAPAALALLGLGTLGLGLRRRG